MRLIPLFVLAPALGLISIALASLAVYGLYDKARINQTHWADYSAAERSLVHALNDLKTHLGYGGFIHHFKNAVLRGGDYIALTEQAFMNAEKQLALLNEKLFEPEAKTALHIISKTMTAYHEKLSEVKALHKAGKTPKDIDQTVQIYDPPALDAFQIISRIIDNRAEVRLAQARREEEELNSQLIRATYALPLLLLVSGGLAWLGIRLETARVEIKQERERFENLPDPALLIDRNGTVRVISRAGLVYFKSLMDTA